MERRYWKVWIGVAAALVMGPVGAVGRVAQGAKEAARAARREGLEATRTRRWGEGRTALERSLKQEPGQPEALFALAVCQAQLGEGAAALAVLRGALAAGFQDFEALRSDPRLATVRATDSFVALLKEAEARAEAFDAALEASCRETHAGSAFRVRRVAPPRLVLVTDLDAPIVDRLVAALSAAEASHRAALFPNGLRHAVVLYAPAAGGSAAGGLFSPASRTLQFNPSAPVGTLLREFARALHFDDQAAHGQMHAPWLTAGLAALYERAATPPDGARGLRDWRFAPLRDSLSKPAFVPLPRLLALEPGQIDSQAVAEARYVLLWLQETGRLPAFYRAYLESWEDDPAGKTALEQATGSPLAAAEATWVEFLTGKDTPAAPPG